MSATVPFNALKPAEDAADVRAAIDRVLASGWFILGPEVEAFEAEFAAASGVPHAVGVGTGTDAITLILRALDIGAGDEVITSPLSAAYSALAVMMAGARPVFADIDPERLTLDPRAAEAAITARTRAIMPVHLYGQAADMRPFEAIARKHNLAIIEDAAQAHLATADGRPVGTIGVAAATSFYPTKNLGAAGDGGAVLTRDAQLAARVKRLRNGGQTTRYRHEEFGVNSRLDEIQAAILRARLKYLPGWTAKRRSIAARYRSALSVSGAFSEGAATSGGIHRVPREFDAGHVYHLFPVLTDARDRFQAHMKDCGIETLIHYPVPITQQPALAATNPAVCETAGRVCAQVVSLPMYPGLSDHAVDAVAAAAATFSR
ncbi:MAG TPA: DegT/DnrJ/EryC1/StrS family aminotransferase [Vicinamibacterales bacterium]|nr:DegT/DnrJ/EryC1/StrS family aminotransferase [Vicinamibacterales bacterium]